MQRISLDALATQQLELAAAHGGRPAADTVMAPVCPFGRGMIRIASATWLLIKLPTVSIRVAGRSVGIAEHFSQSGASTAVRR